jgi:transposase-like protein
MNAKGIKYAGHEIPTPKTLVEAVRMFADEDFALFFMVSLRWPDGKAICPRCGSHRTRFIQTRRQWECREKHPQPRFSIKTGTVMQDSPLSLDKWLIAIWMEANAKNSISSYEVHRALKITQKTAWFLQQRIRLAMQNGDFFRKLTGEVEVDETFIGGAARNMHAEKRRKLVTAPGPMASGKTAVMGLLERHSDKGCSQVRTAVIPNTKRKTLHPLVRENVAPGTLVCTDAHPAYVGLDSEYVHKVIDHAEAYVRGNVHTNGLENFWALFKRCIKGTHISVEPFHLFRYLDAETFRFNERKDNDGGRFLKAMTGIEGKRLTYKRLIGDDVRGAADPVQ